VTTNDAGACKKARRAPRARLRERRCSLMVLAEPHGASATITIVAAT